MTAHSDQPDYETAAQAWMTLACTMAAMDFSRRMVAIAEEYAKRLADELAEADR